MFVESHSLDAEGLTTYILDTLKDYHLDLESIVSQGYYGTSMMSGRCAGVQVCRREPQAIYTHRFVHILNLVLVDCSKNVAHAAKFFALIESLYVFISSMKARSVPSKAD